jgi:hypothetical protein
MSTAVDPTWLQHSICVLLLPAYAYGLAGSTDLMLMVAWMMWKNGTLIYETVSTYTLPIVFAGILVGATALSRYLITSLPQSVAIEQSIERETEAKPLLFPCQTTHTRFFPKKHSFSYSYLLAGVPVGWQGSWSALLSATNAGTDKSQHSAASNGWYSIDAGAYLDRGNGRLGLAGKLKNYLHSQVSISTNNPLYHHH